MDLFVKARAANPGRVARIAAFFFLGVLFVLSGCATAPTRPSAEPRERPLEPGIYELASGERIEPETLFERLVDARFVVVGESHDELWHHEVQTRIYREMVQRSEAPVALGMEMFQRPFQDALDAYMAGEISETKMLERAEYESRWGFPPQFYRPLWELARRRGYPLVALNVRRELTKRVSAVGLDELSKWEARDVPDMDLSRGDYRSWLEDIFRQHGMEPEGEGFERFYQAQVLWDETMAETAVEALLTTTAERMMIVAGRGHVQFDWGIPARIERRWSKRRPGDEGDVVATVIPMNYGAPLPDPDFADYVWVERAPVDSGRRDSEHEL